MGDVIKAFNFNAENITLTLNILKEMHHSNIDLFLREEIISNNEELTVKIKNYNWGRELITLEYKDESFFFISHYNNTNYKEALDFYWKRFPVKREKEYKVPIRGYQNTEELVESYKHFLNYIYTISEYFYHCIKNYKQKKMLFETSIDDVYTDKK